MHQKLFRPPHSYLGKTEKISFWVSCCGFISITIWMWIWFTVCAVAMNWSLCSSYGNPLGDIRSVHRCSFWERVPIVADKTTNRLNRAWVDCVRPCAHHDRFLTKSFVNESFLKLDDRLDLIEFHSWLRLVSDSEMAKRMWIKSRQFLFGFNNFLLAFIYLVLFGFNWLKVKIIKLLLDGTHFLRLEKHWLNTKLHATISSLLKIHKLMLALIAQLRSKLVKQLRTCIGMSIVQFQPFWFIQRCDDFWILIADGFWLIITREK